MSSEKIMSQESADNYYEMLFRFSKVIKLLNLKYWLNCGSLLGAIRETAILSWDKDVDIGMLEIDRLKLWKNKKILKNFGLRTNYADSIFRIGFKNVYMDVFSYKLIDGVYKEIHRKNRKRWPNEYFKKSELFPLKKTKFGLLKSPIPNKSKNYLSRAYINWNKVPEKYRLLKIYKIEPSKKLIINLLEIEKKIREKVRTKEKYSNTSKPKSYSKFIYFFIFIIIIILLIQKK